jgi:hypothetical protein
MSDDIKLKVLVPGEFQYAPGDEVRSDSVLATAGRCAGPAIFARSPGTARLGAKRRRISTDCGDVSYGG